MGLKPCWVSVSDVLKTGNELPSVLRLSLLQPGKVPAPHLHDEGCTSWQSIKSQGIM